MPYCEQNVFPNFSSDVQHRRAMFIQVNKWLDDIPSQAKDLDGSIFFTSSTEDLVWVDQQEALPQRRCQRCQNSPPDDWYFAIYTLNNSELQVALLSLPCFQKPPNPNFFLNPFQSYLLMRWTTPVLFHLHVIHCPCSPFLHWVVFYLLNTHFVYTTQT